MIRLIGRTLIIPRGDTGKFTIPAQETSSDGDIAIISIYDPLYKKTVCEKILPINSDSIEVNFIHEDTVNIEPSKRYKWDIKIYHNPEYDENSNIIGGDSINSYFAAFGTSMPQCIIKQVAQDV